MQPEDHELRARGSALNRRAFIHRGALHLAGAAGLVMAQGRAFGLSTPAEKDRLLRFGLVTDLHYAEKKPAGTRSGD